VEASARLDRRSDDDQLSAAFRGHARDFFAEASRPRPDDLSAHRDSVRARDGGRRLEPLLQLGESAVEVRVQRQLALEDGRRDEHDARAAVGREPAREDERVLGLLLIEQGDDDAAVCDRLRP
jgi:hypothetical protein